MAKYRVSFIYDRHDNRMRAEVEVPDCAPFIKLKTAIRDTLRVNGWPEARDVIMMTSAVTISCVEAGIPKTDEYKNLDILAP